MTTTLRPLLLAASLGAAFFLSSNTALAQGAGGFSAGPGLAAPGQHEQTVTTETTAPKAATQAPVTTQEVAAATSGDEPGYMTRVQTYRPSPSDTQIREFSQTRLWVLDPGRYTVEQWWTGKLGGNVGGTDPNAPNDSFFQSEIEMGIAPHVQVDIYLNLEMEANETGGGSHLTDHTGVAAEVRVALPSYWGETFMNPTLYFEVASQYYNSPRAEFRLLLGGELFTPKLLAAANLLYEQNIFWGPTNTTDMEVGGDFGVNYDLVDGIFKVGAEMQAGWDMHGTRTLQPVLLIGPSVILKTKDNALKLLATLLFGTEPDDPKYKPVIIASVSW
jgi:hypothetical protein